MDGINNIPPWLSGLIVTAGGVLIALGYTINAAARVKVKGEQAQVDDHQLSIEQKRLLASMASQALERGDRLEALLRQQNEQLIAELERSRAEILTLKAELERITEECGEKKP